MAKGSAPAELPIVQAAGRDVWERWLAANHANATGAWLRIAKKDSGLTSVSYAEALEEALCYGWIDGQKRRHDEMSWVQKFTPRALRSIWSQVNRAKADALTQAGRMRPSGLAAIEAAKADGRWDAAYQPQRTSTVPDDLQAAIDANSRARRFFVTLNGANRYALIFRVQTAKRAETRARRIEQFVAMLERGETFHG